MASGLLLLVFPTSNYNGKRQQKRRLKQRGPRREGRICPPSVRLIRKAASDKEALREKRKIK